MSPDPEPSDSSTGRHRHAPGPTTWTPPVPGRPPHARRRRSPGGPTPDVAERPTAHDRFRGELPVSPPGGPLIPDQRTTAPPRPAGPPRNQAARRRKITLPPATETTGETDDEARIYAVSPSAGLGKFDLGTVPASVTPPRSWRRAAWFAAASSGAVVVALLVAGSQLVGSPSDESAISGWTDRHGGQPPPQHLAEGAEDDVSSEPLQLGPQRSPETDPTTTDGGVTGSTGNHVGEGLTGSTPRPPAPGSGAPSRPQDTPPSSGSGTPDDSAPPTSTRPPQKPPVTPPEVVYQEPRPLSFMLPDREAMADNSQDFLNTVTEDSAAAHALTTGELKKQGSAGLARRYDGIAYFVVEKVVVNQDDRITTNTVRVVHDDGSTTRERRTLRFGDGERIADDGGG